MGPLEKIKNAWLRPGINPKEHRAQQAHLRRHWPTLHNAIAEAVEVRADGNITAVKTWADLDVLKRQVADTVHKHFPDASVSCTWEESRCTWGPEYQGMLVAISTTGGTFAVRAALKELDCAVNAACENRKKELARNTPTNYMSWIG